MRLGTGRLFGPGASTQKIVEYIRANVRGAVAHENTDQ
jgi:hypothetical protein